jgi:hypothetical protein
MQKVVGSSPIIRSFLAVSLLSLIAVRLMATSGWPYWTDVSVAV